MPKARSIDKVVVETSPWIALLQGEADRAEHVERLLEQAADGDLQIYTSALTIAEVTKGPKASDPTLSAVQEKTFRDFLDNEFVTLVSVDPVVAEQAATLRKAVPGLRTADAIHIATAVVIRAGIFYTYDDQLLKLDGDASLDGLQVRMPPVDHQMALALPGGE